ncbi:MAG: cytochrome c biogenesis protein CcdA, partial [Dehalococcoidia bacterium]|nr:cytochrome c biogenesis protein CcdA [Dehalococcoidia bacterium]
MASESGAFRRPSASRNAVYLLLAVLAVLPLIAFGLGPLTSDSFSLKGPGGPILAFSAGVLSFVSPCVLPLVPIYITHLSGSAIEGGKVVANRRITFTHAVAFVLGLSFVFILLGTSAGLLGSYFLKDSQRDMEKIAGVFLLAMGLLMVPSYGRTSPMKAGLLLLGLTGFYFFLASVADLRATADHPADRQGLLFL